MFCAWWQAVLDRSASVDPATAMAISTLGYDSVLRAGERHEGVAAFVERRPTSFPPLGPTGRPLRSNSANRGLRTLAARHSRRGLATAAGPTTVVPPPSEEELEAVRESVRALCSKYDGKYWRDLEKAEEKYPKAFVDELQVTHRGSALHCLSLSLSLQPICTVHGAWANRLPMCSQAAGYLSILVPEKYGGGGQGLLMATTVLEEIHRAGCNAAAAHAQMYTMGSLVKSGSAEQKQEWLPKIASGEVRLQVTRRGSQLLPFIVSFSPHCNRSAQSMGHGLTSGLPMCSKKGLRGFGAKLRHRYSFA